MPITELLVEMLKPAEMFVVCAARVHRALRELTAPPNLCLCRIFQAADIPEALAPFAFFQAALAGDPARSFHAEERGLRVLGSAEVNLLHAVATWQLAPASHPERALGFVSTATVRRIAAPAGHAFALEMASVGLWVRAPDLLPPAEPTRPSCYSRGLSDELQYVH